MTSSIAGLELSPKQKCSLQTEKLRLLFFFAEALSAYSFCYRTIKAEMFARLVTIRFFVKLSQRENLFTWVFG